MSEHLLLLDGSEVEEEIARLDAELAALGQLARARAGLLFRMSRAACVAEVGERTARCHCWWEQISDTLDDLKDDEKPLWRRLEDRAVTYDQLAAGLGADHVPPDDFLCDAKTCDCPYYDEQGKQRAPEETERLLGGSDG